MINNLKKKSLILVASVNVHPVAQYHGNVGV